MNNDFKNLQQGLRFEMTKTAEPKDSAAQYDSGLVDVFSTPAMIALMEGTAYRCVMDFLPKGFTTVGFQLNIKHVKATPIGMKVRCEAELQNIDGKRLEFFVRAWDEQDLIGEGMHVRYIIDQQKFTDKLKQH